MTFKYVNSLAIHIILTQTKLPCLTHSKQLLVKFKMFFFQLTKKKTDNDPVHNSDVWNIGDLHNNKIERWLNQWHKYQNLQKQFQ
jgi:hypothetical protein